MYEGRLFGILFTLLRQGKSTAPVLAAQFDVSIRTIYRDVDALSAAGIPVYMTNGRSGGIYLSESFRLEKTTLSHEEQAEIMLGLQSLGAVQYPGIDAILLKLGALFTEQDRTWIEVDLSRWGTADIVARDQLLFALLRKAIIGQLRIRFEYHNAKGEMLARHVEPLRLVYRDRAWYLLGYCLTRDAIRIFRLSRMKNPTLTETKFEREVPEGAMAFDKTAFDSPLVPLRLRFDGACAHRLYDLFDDAVIAHQPDGSILVENEIPENEWLYGFLMSFGDQVTILAPDALRKEVALRMRSALERLEA